MDRIPGGIDPAVALDNISVVVDQQQVAHTDRRERLTERVDPEPVQMLGIPRGDVTAGAFVESPPCQDPQGGGQLALAS